MPVKLGSKFPSESEGEARIEIVPLIDIMFFLLASFMLVSLTMVNLKSMKVNLPTATTATPDTAKGKDIVDVSVDKAGVLYLNQAPMGANAMTAALIAQRRGNANLRVLISGDADARHGDVIRALDIVRSAGIEKVGFEIRPIYHTGKHS